MLTAVSCRVEDVSEPVPAVERMSVRVSMMARLSFVAGSVPAASMGPTSGVRANRFSIWERRRVTLLPSINFVAYFILLISQFKKIESPCFLILNSANLLSYLLEH